MRFSLRKKEKKCSSACCVTGGRNGGNPLGMIVAAESAVEDGAGMQERADRLIGPSQEADRLMSVAAGDWPPSGAAVRRVAYLGPVQSGGQ